MFFKIHFFRLSKTEKILDSYQPIGRVGQPEDIAKTVAFIIADESASFMTGSNVLVDGGLLVGNMP